MSLNNLKSELVFLLRNNDIFTTTQRGVTTTTTTADPVVAATTYDLDVTNVKNIRELKVDTTVLQYGKDYTVDTDYISTTKKCRITFTTAQTGDVVVKYDAGTDKIWNDYPRYDLTISSYPRISVEEVSKTTTPLSLGGTDFISSRVMTIIVYSEDQDFIEQKLAEIELLIRTNAKSLYYAKFISPTGRGPIIKHEGRSETILQKNVDLLARFEIE